MKVSATVCFSMDSVKKVPAKGTSGKDMDVGYDPLVRGGFNSFNINC